MGLVERISTSGAGSDEAELVEAVRDSVRAFAKARPMQQDEAGRKAEWQEVADAGWLGLLADAAVGGSELSLEIMAALHEELGRAGVVEPYCAVSVLALAAIDQCEPGKERDALLGELTSGAACPVLCWQDEPNRDDRDLPFVVIGQSGGSDVSAGRVLIDFADRATHFCIPADRQGRAGLLVIGRDDPGLAVSLVPSLSGSSLGRLEFNGRVADAAFLPLPDRSALAPAFILARIAAAAQLSGLCARITAMTVEFASQRVQFGKAIATNQVVQHRLVDMWSQHTLAASAVGNAARACSSGVTSGELAALAAKARAGTAADAVTKGAFQLHGAIGYTGEYPLGALARGCLSLTNWLGAPGALGRRFVELERSGEQSA